MRCVDVLLTRLLERTQISFDQRAEDNAVVLEAQKYGGIETAECRRMLIARVHGANTSSAQRIGQNNWPMVARTEFPNSFFEAVETHATV
jgi:hypothetical protein